jgi:MYXO-CTERM domain-containing protein
VNKPGILGLGAKPCLSVLPMVAALSSVLAIQPSAFAETKLPVRHSAHAAAAKTPPGVPASYVITPNGFFHPSCVVTVAPDERLDPDLVIRTLAGVPRATVPPCAYPRFDFQGRTVSSREPANPAPTMGAPPAPQLKPAGAAWDGYPVLYSYTGSSWGSYLSDTWIVPPPPTTVASGEVVFLWNAVQTSNSLLQPVLGFNDDGVNMEWQISSWNCCTSGISGQTGGTAVNPGDVIQGTVTGANCDDSTGVCQNWTITATDLTSGQSEVLNTTSPNGTPQNIDPGVLETYGVTSCDMFPPTGEVAFYDHTLNDVNGSPVSLTYDLITLVDPDPSLPTDCGYTGTASGSTYTLIFSNSPTEDAGACVTPSGSYLESCTSCAAAEGASGCILTCASCGKIDGTQNSGPTLPLPCDGTISNNNGALECDGSAGSEDAGDDAASSDDGGTAKEGGLAPADASTPPKDGGSTVHDSGAPDAGRMDASLPPPSFGGGGGAEGGADAGADEGSTPLPSVGCSCETASHSRSPASMLGVGGLVFACVWRRRKKKRSACARGRSGLDRDSH